MPTALINPLPYMLGHAGQTVRQFGIDNAGTTEYRINLQGWRADKAQDFQPKWAFFGTSIVFGIGVELAQAFPSQFASSHNYGFAGEYDNQDIRAFLDKFLKSEFYHEDLQMVVVWRYLEAYPPILDQYVQELAGHHMMHFFPDYNVGAANCFPVFKNIDIDLTGSHMGPKTHAVMARCINDYFRKL